MSRLSIALHRAARSLRGAAWLLLVGAASSGCSGQREETATVIGTVLFDGKPVPGGRVIFQNKESGRAMQSEISSEGKYRLRAPLGKASIAVVYEEPPHEVQYGGNSGKIRKEMVPGKSYVPKRYASPRTSPIEYDVIKGTNEFEVNVLKQ